jgi:hypothetical protein
MIHNKERNMIRWANESTLAKWYVVHKWDIIRTILKHESLKQHIDIYNIK